MTIMRKGRGFSFLLLSCGAHSTQQPHYRSQNTEETVNKENQMCHVPTIKELHGALIS